MGLFCQMTLGLGYLTICQEGYWPEVICRKIYETFWQSQRTILQGKVYILPGSIHCTCKYGTILKQHWLACARKDLRHFVIEKKVPSKEGQGLFWQRSYAHCRVLEICVQGHGILSFEEYRTFSTMVMGYFRERGTNTVYRTQPIGHFSRKDMGHFWKQHHRSSLTVNSSIS